TAAVLIFLPRLGGAGDLLAGLNLVAAADFGVYYLSKRIIHDLVTRIDVSDPPSPLLLRLRRDDDLADDDERRGGHRHRDNGTEHTAESAAGDRGDDDECTGHIDRGSHDAGAEQVRLDLHVHEIVDAGGNAQSRGDHEA